MANSFSKKIVLTCSYCEQSFKSDAWLIIDAHEHPGLLSVALDVILFLPRCTCCDRRDTILLNSLLLYFPDEPYPLAFVPAPSLPSESIEAAASEFVSYLKKTLKNKWKNKWIAKGISLVLRQKLPGYLEFYFNAETKSTS